MARVEGLHCAACGRDRAPKATDYVCLSCGGNLEAVYDLAAAKRRLTRKSLAA
ncbi:MAG: hypothetical protein FD126_1744, partial [Elusimicrobia bacterium]